MAIHLGMSDAMASLWLRHVAWAMHDTRPHCYAHYKGYTDQLLHDRHGLYRIPLVAPWKAGAGHVGR